MLPPLPRDLPAWVCGHFSHLLHLWIAEYSDPPLLVGGAGYIPFVRPVIASLALFTQCCAGWRQPNLSPRKQYARKVPGWVPLISYPSVSKLWTLHYRGRLR